MNREDFPILKNDIIYFDNGATTFKPKKVIDGILDYYENYTANAHRGDYNNSLKVDEIYENTRNKVSKFINSKSSNEIIFTKGTTESINMIAFGYMKYYLKKNDEIILSKSEHASNILPWIELSKEIGIIIKYVDLDENYNITNENLNKIITEKTKVISLAHITNAIGDIRNLEMIGNICKEKNIILVVDAAQSIGHIKVDVQKYNISFLAFSSHKMLGPTGTGILYGKYELLNNMKILEYGGGMNIYFEANNEVEYKELPERLEAGTQNIEGVIGLSYAIDYLNEIGLDKIHEYEVDLKKYAVRRLKEVDGITIYNENTESGIIIFNIDKIFSQDLAVYLNHYNICVRSGNHCAKELKDEIKATNTCRASLYMYNTKEEIDKLVDVLKNRDNIYDIIL